MRIRFFSSLSLSLSTSNIERSSHGDEGSISFEGNVPPPEDKNLKNNFLFLQRFYPYNFLEGA